MSHFDGPFSMGGVYAVNNIDRSSWLGRNVRVAGTSCDRRRGLLGIERLDEGEGLWISPCEAIHTFGMKMPIDVIFLDDQRRVTKLVSRMRHGRIAICLRASSVLEIKAGTIQHSGTAVGDRLQFEAASANG